MSKHEAETATETNSTPNDGDLLDDIEQELRGRGKDDAMHSGALADAVGIDDGEGNPQTREAIRTLMEERGAPIASGNCGYWYLESKEQLTEYVASLEGRITGIEQRIDMVQRNYERAEARRGESGPTPADIRREIKRSITAADTAMRDDLVIEVSRLLDCEATVVQEQLAEMEQNGFVYLDGAEVKLP